jgi:hypothetical protein
MHLDNIPRCKALYLDIYCRKSTFSLPFGRILAGLSIAPPEPEEGGSTVTLINLDSLLGILQIVDAIC